MSLDDVNVHLVTCTDDAQELLRWLGERRPVLALDLETAGLRWWDQPIRLAQLGDARTGWAVPYQRWSGVIAEALSRYDGPIVGHNLRFDLRFLYRDGIEVPLTNVHDTMLAASVLWPDRRLGLKHLATQFVDPLAGIGEQQLELAMMEGKWTWATVPVDMPAYWAYGALDTVLTAQLFEHMQPLLDTDGVRGVYELECAVNAILFKMETRGARIDLPFCHEKYDQLLTYAHDLRAWCQATFGVSPGSSDAVIRYLEQAGYAFTKRTKGGKPALDEEVLLRIDHPLAQAVLNVRKSEKVANAYFRNFIDLADGDRLHCSIRQTGAKTGRMSVTDPALQTLPRDNKIVRGAFIPSEGNRIVTIDYEQIEMRLLAHFAGEEEMIRRIRAGVDMHTAVAQVIYGLGDTEPPKHLRQITKNANFAKAYVAGPRKFAETAGISEQEGRDFYALYDTTFPGVKRFQQQVCEVAEQRYLSEGRAYVRAPSGRLHIATDVDAVYKCVNYLIQGCAADVLKERLVALDLAGFSDYAVLPIHDEVLFDFPEEEAEALTAEAVRVMEDHTSFRVPLTVDASRPLERWEKT